MKIENYADLANKTVFDFTNDRSLLEDILLFPPTNAIRCDYYKTDCHPINKISDILKFAIKTNNVELEKAAKIVRNELRIESDHYAKECYEKDESIID